MDQVNLEAGEFIVYLNGNRAELGRVKRVADDGAFVFYSEGDTASKTPFDHIFKIDNAYVIKQTSLGGIE